MRITIASLFCVLLVVVVGCGGGKNTVVTITNKISTLGAGEFYLFAGNFQHDQKKGITFSITAPANGGGTLVQYESSAGYIAPATPPSSSNGQVTLTATANNGSGASDSDTFTITPATGPFVTITPVNFTVSGGDGPTELAITVLNDTCTTPGGCLAGTVSSDPGCGTSGSSVPCGSLGAISGVPGSGHYTVEYTPPSDVPSGPLLELISILSTLPNACLNQPNALTLCPGNTMVIINGGS